MTRLKYFFIGLLLLCVVFCTVVLSAFIYQANDKSDIKTYIFQMNSLKNQRVGALQNINDMSAIDLRDKLIKKYVSEYFKVIPGAKDLTENILLKNMSFSNAYTYWKKNTAPEISRMSSDKKFRMVFVPDDGIVAMNMPNGYDYYNTTDTQEPIFYSVKYYTLTWDESNYMATEPVSQNGTIYIQAYFEPIIREEIEFFDNDDNIKKMSVQQYLESGKDPALLFRFRVKNIDDGKK